MTTQSPRPPLVVPWLVFLSGALGLVYEVLWMRHFVVVFGASTLATAATLSGFFLGLAAGSVVFGARAARWQRPLAAFGWLELGVAAGAPLVPPVLQLYGAYYPRLYGSLAGVPGAFAALKLALALIAVAIPTFCMGGTLPALAEAVAGRDERGRGIGRLYAINVAGATGGALAVPFVLLPALGVRGTYLLAVAGSVTVGLTVLWLARSRGRDAPAATFAKGVVPPPTAVLVLAAVSGFATLALQTFWTRMFALVHESSIHSFVAIVVLFLVGLAGGAAWVRAGRSARPPARTLALAWSAAGLLIVVSPRLLHWLTDGLSYLSERGDDAFTRLLVLGAIIVLPAAVALGTAVPLLLEMAGGGGAHVGRLLGVNTVGAIVGPLAATFVLAPWLGLWWSLVLLGVMVAAAGALAGLERRGQAAVVVVVSAAGLLTAPGALPPVRVRAVAGETLISVQEGSHGTTAVVEDPHDRWITVNNSYVLGGTAEAGEERFQGHLPLLLHPSPRRVAFLGLGTGITAGAALRHPVEGVLAIEIVPEVVTAARNHFADHNERLLEDSRVTVIVEDARNVLAASPTGFDVVVGDLLVPWRPGEAALYSRDHFESVRRALAPGGLFCQWLPLYQLSHEQAAILLRTFADVFPRTTVWRGNFLPGHATLALVGHALEAPLDVADIDSRVAALAPSVEAANPFLAHPAGFWLFAVGALDTGAAWLGERRHTDDTPWIELLSPATQRGQPIGLTGEPLMALYDRIATVSTEGTPLAGLDATHRTWREKGAALARASLGDERHVFSLLLGLPPELQRSLGVTRSPGPSRGE
jgi:spermidine synthase